MIESDDGASIEMLPVGSLFTILAPFSVIPFCPFASKAKVPTSASTVDPGVIRSWSPAMKPRKEFALVGWPLKVSDSLMVMLPGAMNSKAEVWPV